MQLHRFRSTQLLIVSFLAETTGSKSNDYLNQVLIVKDAVPSEMFSQYYLFICCDAQMEKDIALRNTLQTLQLSHHTH